MTRAVGGVHHLNHGKGHIHVRILQSGLRRGMGGGAQLPTVGEGNHVRSGAFLLLAAVSMVMAGG